MDKRRFIDLLPENLRTEVLSKFFVATVDQVFQPGSVEALAGYIGQKPSYYNPETDFYIGEPTALRSAHQLEVGLVTRTNGAIDRLMTIDDFVNYIKSNNGIAGDQNRLFSDDYYAWAPPVDLDKLNNATQYRWFGDAPNLVPFMTLTAPYTETVADGVNGTFPLPPALPGLTAAQEQPIVFCDDIVSAFDRSGDEISLVAVPAEGTIVRIYRYGSIETVLTGLTAFDPSIFGAPVTALTSGMRVVLDDGVTYGSGWDTLTFESIFTHGGSIVDIPWDTQNAPTTFFVEGVGVGIQLVEFELYPNIVEKTPIHVVCDRRSRDLSPWARINYWVHADAVSWSGNDFPDRRGTRPIIEFTRDLELYNYGTTRREDINGTSSQRLLCVPPDVVKFQPGDEVSNLDFDAWEDTAWEASALQYLPLSVCNGQPFGTLYVDGGHKLVFGDRILVLADENEDLSHRIFTVSPATTSVNGVDTQVMALIVEDLPTEGDVVRQLIRGTIPFETTSGFDMDPWEYDFDPIEYWYDGTEWPIAQARLLSDSDPLFELYTPGAVRLEKLGPFTGSKIFSFAQGSGALDTVLNRQLAYDASGEIQFVDTTNVAGAACRFTRTYTNGYDLSNGWRTSAALSHQAFTGTLFDVPVNLASNPDNLYVDTISKSQWFQQLTETISGQKGFVGNAYAKNNFRDTLRDLTIGKTIIQNRSPLLRAMLLASDTRFDYFDAVRYVDNEYSRFRTKFVRQITEVERTGQCTDADGPDTWVLAILGNLKVAKTNEFPFALSDVAGGRFFIPPTAAWLGLLPPVKPRMEVDSTYEPAVTMLRGHDGSRTPAFGDMRDTILLALETRIYNSILAQFKSEASPPFDFFDYLDGRDRSAGNGDNSGGGSDSCSQALPNPPTSGGGQIDNGSTTTEELRYTTSDIVSIYTPIFLRWVQTNGLDYRTNTGYIIDDPFTWNYRDLLDRDGRAMSGNWRAIYKWFFDTDRPHSDPWEMLGFADKPSWWDDEYGAAPYTSGNLHLWQDLRDGMIRRGPRAGLDSRFARPNLLSYLPVDEDGTLLDPVAARLVSQVPTEPQAKRDWIVGDIGPVENLWMNSVSYPFARSIIGGLIRPALWVEVGFDRADLLIAQNDYWLSARTGARPHAADSLIHGEVGQDGTRVVNIGFQQWIVDAMTSKAIPASVLGDACRAVSVQLLHKMAGFTSTSGMRVFADNLGLIPIEDVEVVYYTSPPIREAVYSGVIVEWNGEGWRVIGYDPGSESFCTMPGDPNGPTQTISLGPDTVIYEWHPNVYYPQGRPVEYQNSIYVCAQAHTSSKVFEDEFWTPEPSLSPKQSPRVVIGLTGDGTTISVPYDTVYETYQEVADFLSAYARYLEAVGFVFDGIDPVTGAPQTWEQAIRDFLEWAQVSWPVGTAIALSPGASSLKFVTAQGYVMNLEEAANGIYGLTNRTGRRILAKDTFITREDDTTSIVTLTDDLWACRVRVSEIEHVLAFKNKTLFSDLIYDPLLALRQPRLRLVGERTVDWAGRRDAPGFLVVGNDLITAFDKTSQDVRTMYEIEHSDRKDFRDFTRQMLGYQPRSYLNNLLISETQQLEFFQGMIKAKGSVGSFDKLARSTFIEGDREIQFLEEWGILRSRFGAVNTRVNAAFTLIRPDIRSNPQLITFGIDNPNDAILGITDDSDRWVTKPANPEQIFNGRATVSTPFVPDAGYVRIDEISKTAFSYDNLNALFVDQPYDFLVGTKIWIYDRDVGGFDVVQAYPLGASTNEIAQVIGSDEDPSLDSDADETQEIVSYTRVVMATDHGLTPDDVGMHVCITGSSLSEPALTGFYRISSIDSARSFLIPGQTVTSYDYVAQGVQPPDILAFRSIRFADRNAAALFTGRFPPTAGQFAYVDDTGNGTWAVYTYDGTAWSVYRQQPRKIDSSRLSTVRLYDAPTEITRTSIQAEPLLLDRILVLDPILGMLPGDAMRELTYQQQSDPAQYFGDANARWGAKQVGQLWWDVSTVRYLQAETDIIDSDDPDRMQREMAYRVRYWGQIAPGSQITVYEWTRSYVEPLSSDFLLKDPGNGASPYYNIVQEYDEATGTTVSAYYYWIMHPQVVPVVPGRQISAYDVAVLLTSQALNGLPWVAPVAPNALLVGNCDAFVTAETSVLSFEVIDPTYEGEVHTEWQLVSPDSDKADLPKEVWDKLRDSLVGFDHDGDPVPSPSVPALLSVGVGAEQTMFSGGRDGMLRARRSFVTKLNQMLFRTNTVIARPDLVAAFDTFSDTWANLMWTKDLLAAEDARPPQGSYADVGTTVDERDHIITGIDYALCSRAVPMELVAWDVVGWDVDLSGDRRIYQRGPRVALGNYRGAIPSWTVWEIDPDSQAVEPQNLRIAKNFDVVVATRADRDAQAAAGNLVQWQRVLVQSDENAGGLWTTWLYTADPGINGPFTFETAEGFKLDDFVSQVDWYADGYDSLHAPVVTYDTIADRTDAEMPNPTNVFVEVLDDGTGRWIWTEWDGMQWVLVAQEKGTIALSSAFFDASRAVYTPTEAGLSSAAVRDGARELRAVINAVYQTMEVTEVKELFFSMLHFIHTQQDQVEWAFKTSFMSIVGVDQHLAATPIATYDNTENLIAYLEEVKPYRTKIRDYSRVINPDLNVANVHIGDFDKPVYYDAGLGRYRSLNPNNQVDAIIIQTQEPWKDWYAAQSIAPALNPVRKLDITLRFDRIDPYATPLVPGFGWDIVPWDTSAWDDENAVVNLAGSALTRMLAYYAPSEGMRAKDATAIFDLAYKGTFIDGGTLLPQPLMDTPIVGTDEATASVLINPVGPELAAGFADPYRSANRPQELSAISGNDALQIRVTSASRLGQPARSAIYLDLTDNRQSTVQIGLPRLPSSAEAVFVYVDGAYIDPTGYTIDYVDSLVSIPVSATAKVASIVVIGEGTTTEVLEDEVHVGYPAGGYTLNTVPTPGQPQAPHAGRPWVPYGADAEVEVIVDGVVLTSGISVRGQTVTISPAPGDGSFVQITLRKSAIDLTDPTIHVHRQVFTADDTGALQASLTNPPSLNWAPSHIAAILYSEGRELAPPFTRFATLDSDTSVLPFTAITAPSLLWIYLNQQIYGGTTYQSSRDLIPDWPVGDVPDVDRSEIEAGLALDDTPFESWPFDVESAFIICEDRIVAAPGVTGRVMATTLEKRQFRLDGDQLLVSAGGSAGREITAVTMDRTSTLWPGLNVFAGDPNGLYPIEAKVPGIEYLNVSLNGVTLAPNKQFGVQRRVLGFEEEVFEYSGFGADEGVRTLITIPGSQTDDDVVVIHSTSAPVISEGQVTTAATTGPSGSRMGTQVYSDGSPLSVTTNRGDRGVYRMDGSYEVNRSFVDEAYPLAADLLADATEIRVDVSNRDTVGVPFAPSLDTTTPSAIWIGSERIEYFAVEMDGEIAVLSGLRRGSRGTSVGEEQRVSATFTGGTDDLVFTLTGGRADVVVEVALVDANGIIQPLYLGSYTVASVTGGIAITLTAAIPAGSTLRLAQSFGVLHPQGELVEPIVGGADDNTVFLNFLKAGSF